MIDPPLWLIILPIAASPVVYLTRRWFVGVVLAALTSLFTGLLAWIMPPTHSIRLMGRPFLLDALTQHILALLFIMAAVLFLLTWRLPQRRSFLPFGLIMVGLIAAVGMARHLGIAALMMVLTAIVGVPVIQGGQAGSTRAAWRFLVMVMLALPFFLLASWRIDLYREDVQNAVYLGQAALFLGLSLSIWLAVVPLHGWLTAAGAEAPPLAAALVITAFPLLGLMTLVQILNEATWFTWHQQAARLLLMTGLISAATAGVLAAVQRGLRPLMGYAALFDLGCLLVALGIGGEGGALAFSTGLAVRGLGLGMIGAATAAIGQAAGGDGLTMLRGVAHRAPLATVALLVGGLTLAGLPLTAGFVPRWFLVQDLARIDSRWVWLVVAAGLGVAVGYLRILYAMLEPPVSPARSELTLPTWPATLIVLALALISLALGFFPGPLLDAAQRLLTTYSLPSL